MPCFPNNFASAFSLLCAISIFLGHNQALAQSELDRVAASDVANVKLDVAGATSHPKRNGISVSGCFPSMAPCPDPQGAKNRFISFSSGEPGRQQAIRIVFMDLPAPHNILNDLVMWVGQPQDVSEAGGSVEPFPGFPNFKAAVLQCEPFLADWSTFGVVHVYHEGIVPSATYAVQVVDSTCDVSLESSFSYPLVVPTSRWSDMVCSFVDDRWLPPDGSVNFLDVAASTDKFVGLLSAPSNTRMDIAPGVLDLRVELTDYLWPVRAFAGAPYPFPPAPPPVGCSFSAIECGNGVVEPGEGCDDGNTLPGDGCDGSCRSELCGNGAIDAGEECDDGNVLAGDGCDDNCRQESICANGIIECGEECDDGNTAPGDGCDESCRVEGSAVISLIPLGNDPNGSLNPGVTIEGNEIILPSGGHQVFLEIRIADWDAGNTGVELKTWQVMLDSSGFTSGAFGALGPKLISCNDDATCTTVFGGVCWSGALCSTDSDCPHRCEGSLCGFPTLTDPQFCEPGFTNKFRADFVVGSAITLPAVDLSTPDFRYGSSVIFPSSVPDPGVSTYAGTLVIDVPEDAAGTFTVGFRPGWDETFLSNGDNLPIGLAAMEPARITVAVPLFPCCRPDGTCSAIPPSACTDSEGIPVPTCFGDLDGNGINDACECSASSAVQPDPILLDVGHGTTNRHLSFSAGDPGRNQAIRVTLLDLLPPFDTFNAATMWVGEPREYCENSGQAEPPEGGCGPAPGLPSPTFWGATFQCMPSYTEWGVYDIVHVYHESVVPGGVYAFQVIDQACDAGVEASYSAPLSVETSAWGDILKDCTTTPCGPPQGIVNISDVTGILDKFRNLSGAPIKARTDLVGLPGSEGELDQIVSILDVTWDLDAFIGGKYEFAITDPCAG